MLRTSGAFAVFVLVSSQALGQTPAMVEQVAQCNIEMSHAELANLQTMFLARQWSELQIALGHTRQRLGSDCPPEAFALLPRGNDAILFSWVGVGADGVKRVHTAINPMRRPYELSFGDSNGADDDRYFEVLLTDRRGLEVVGRVTSEAKEHPLVAGATSLLATSAGQIATAVSTATLGLPTTATATGSTSAAGSPVATPAMQPAKVLDTARSAPPPSPPPPRMPSPTPLNMPMSSEEIVIATVRRVAVAHRFGTVKSVRKVTQPKLPAEIEADFQRAVAPIRRRWFDDANVGEYLKVAGGVANQATQLCPASSTADACRERLVAALGKAAPRAGMAPDVAAADTEVRRFFAELAAASYDDELTLRNERLDRLAFTTMTGYVLAKDEAAKSRVKVTSNGADFDPLPSALVGFGVSLAAQPYQKGSNDLSFLQRLRFGTGVVAAPNLGAFATVGVAFLPRVGIVGGVSSMRIPKAVTEDRKDYLRGAGGVLFFGLQVEFQ